MVRTSQLAPAVVMGALSALVIFETRHMVYWADYAPGPAFVPWWVGGIGLLLSIILGVQVLAAGPTDGAGEKTPISGLLRAGATLAALLAFLALTPVLGLLTSALLTAGSIMIFVLRRPPIPSLLTVAVTGLLIHGIFIWWLQLPLLKGPFGF